MRLTNQKEQISPAIEEVYSKAQVREIRSSDSRHSRIHPSINSPCFNHILELELPFVNVSTHWLSALAKWTDQYASGNMATHSDRVLYRIKQRTTLSNNSVGELNDFFALRKCHYDAIGWVFTNSTQESSGTTANDNFDEMVDDFTAFLPISTQAKKYALWKGFHLTTLENEQLCHINIAMPSNHIKSHNLMELIQVIERFSASYIELSDSGFIIKNVRTKHAEALYYDLKSVGWAQ